MTWLAASGIARDTVALGASPQPNSAGWTPSRARLRVAVLDAATPREAARAALAAATSGHFVFASVDGRDTVDALVRLMEWGVDPRTLAENVRGVVAQRHLRSVAGGGRVGAGVEPHHDDRARRLARPGHMAEGARAQRAPEARRLQERAQRRVVARRRGRIVPEPPRFQATRPGPVK